MCAGAGLLHLRQQTCAECVCGCARDVGWDKDDVWFAHCCMLDKAETHQFASCGIGIAHCPSSNMRLASGIAPVASYLDAGVSCSITLLMAGVYSQPLLGASTVGRGCDTAGTRQIAPESNQIYAKAGL